MRVKKIGLIAASLGLIAINFILGNAISTMLTVAIVGSCVFYILQLTTEEQVQSKASTLPSGDIDAMIHLANFAKQRTNLYSLALLAIVFIFSIIAVKKIVNPSTSQPWYFNNDHYGISNKAIGFDDDLHFQYTEADSLHAEGSIQFKQQNGKVYLHTQNVFTPIFMQVSDGKEKKYKLLNNVFAAKIANQFSLQNNTTSIDVNMQTSDVSIWNKLKGNDKRNVKYTIQVHCADAALLAELNLPNPYNDVLEIEDEELHNGKSLYNLFAVVENCKSQKAESQHLLEQILAQLDETYLIVNYDEAENKSYALFPDKACIENGYTLKVSGNATTTNLTTQVAIDFNKKFHIGFNHSNEKLFLDKIENKTALVFDFPQNYLLTHPGLQHHGDKHIRFIATSYDDVITHPLKEGFYFSHANLKSNYAVQGQMEFTSHKPQHLLSATYADVNKGATFKKINKSFWLTTQDTGVDYLFELRDFSDNGFSYNKIISYATYLFLLFCGLLFFARSNKLHRIEPIIWTAVYALLIVRFIMYWRIATFPPLENISKYEFENTLIGFDFSLFGIAFPFPVTLLFTTGIVAALVAFRLLKKYMPSVFATTLLKSDKWKLNTPSNINKVFVILMLGLLLLHFIVHVEFLRRIIDVILPLLSYHFFSAKANQYFEASVPSINAPENKVVKYIRVFAYYFIYNPTFIITASTILFFAIADRGFCILFILFVLLKNVLLNFFKKSFDGSNSKFVEMFTKPWNYWIYGAIGLVLYLFILGFKSLFYYLLIFKLWVGLLLLLAVVGCLYLLKNKSKLFYASAGTAIIYFIILLIPYTRNVADKKITDAIKHVQFRASIIHQPISSLLVNNAYNSFNTRKIIETAENQWFINTYITKPYDNDKQINLRAFSKVGVNYNTQTRDVVVARFIISELGQMTMILLLVLLALPMIIYLLSYKIRLDSAEEYTSHFDVDSYAGLIPLLILFTISLFVWLTATNRFVFFGQDFPFLSLTSRVSVLVPMLLFFLTLIQSPVAYNAKKMNLQLGLSRYLILMGVIVLVAYATVRSNELNNNNFNVIVNETKENIEGPFNQMLISLQDSLQSKHIKYSYTDLIKKITTDERYKTFKLEKVDDIYTKSILTALEKNPSSALRANSPLYIVYDQGKYEAVYNKNLYLELPATENIKVWNGNIAEANPSESNTAYLHYGNSINTTVALPYFKSDNINAVQLALLPKTWFVNATEPIGIINVQNQIGKPVHIAICKNQTKNMEQKANNFVHTIAADDLVMVDASTNHFQISFNKNLTLFATNKWLNGEYKTVYPQKENNFWMYHFANAMKNVYTQDSVLNKNIAITLDYNWFNTTQSLIHNSYKNRQSRKMKFTVIAADGDGNIRLMNDYVKNRKQLDPNNATAIYNLQQKHFFFSNTGNERDQWANANLIHMHLGPGSSIKPLMASVIASQVNAGWEKMKLSYTNLGEQNYYAGLKLAKPWEPDADSYDGQGMSDYIRKSSNYYQSVMLFLGSYPKADFMDSMHHADVKNILTTKYGANNLFPRVIVDGVQYALPNYAKGKGNWPSSDKSKSGQSYFANENSVLVNGLEVNAGLACKDKDKNDMSVLSSSRTNFTDSTIYATLNKNKSSSFIWSFPEESAFPQKNRHYISSKKKNEINENFNLGLKTATLGGYPYQLSAYKMLEMYNGLMTQNKNYELHILPKKNKYTAWMLDSTWTRAQYNEFLANNIFKGMADVITAGTATQLAPLKAQHTGYYFYAKTGTINEGGSQTSNSRRLIVSITNKDLTKPENIGQGTKVFSYYFVTDNTQDFDWGMLRTIIHQGFLQASFINYFNQP